MPRWLEANGASNEHEATQVRVQEHREGTDNGHLFSLRHHHFPFALFYYSSNTGIFKNDATAIQNYLDYFRLANPRLTACIADAHQKAAAEQSNHVPREIYFWPNKKKTEICCIPGIVMSRHTRYSFSQACGFFWRLEAAGWKSKELLAFLCDRVEGYLNIPEGEKVEFRHAAERVTKNDIITPFLDVAGMEGHLSFLFWSPCIRQPKEWEGTQVEEVSLESGSLDWLMKEGAIIQPSDKKPWSVLNHLRGQLPLWQDSKSTNDLEKGRGSHKWQFMESEKYRLVSYKRPVSPE
ncbi:hypothetical protein B0H19DRAFT_1081123 [Mycena capillaripes]|nr:hypothetical protein B0H19DRAFT_1081123 [Mycena capillaripes]